mgnify:CR=1 FL=1
MDSVSPQDNTFDLDIVIKQLRKKLDEELFDRDRVIEQLRKSMRDEFHDFMNKKNGWISVKDTPPSRDVPILVYGDVFHFPVSVRWKEDGTYGEPGFFQEGDEDDIKEDDISHWMPLPEAPSE